eukprot:7527885-Pyramimonas_sp.AAC.1
MNEDVARHLMSADVSIIFTGQRSDDAAQQNNTRKLASKATIRYDGWVAAGSPSARGRSMAGGHADEEDMAAVTCYPYQNVALRFQE